MNRRSCTRLALALILLASFLFEPLGAQGRSLEDLSQQINDLLYRPRFRSTSWGIQILDPDRNEILFAKNADKLFIPASNTKLFTTATAFEKLGPNFRFKTNLYVTETPSDLGVVDGDLILEGRGAFNFANMIHASYSYTGILTDLAIQLAAKGIRQINGNIIAQDAYFPHSHEPRLVRTYSKRGRRRVMKVVQRPYDASACSLSVNDNTIRVVVSPGSAPGKPVAVFTLPETRFLKVENRGVTGPRRSKRTLTVAQKGDNRIIINGRLPVTSTGFHTSLPINDPPKFMATLFKDTLARHGVRVKGSIICCYGRSSCGGARESWQLMAVHESLPLVNIIEVINKDSHNSLSELLLRSLGAEVKGSGTPDAGLAVEEEFLRGIVINPAQVSLVDGSGLSKENLVTPQAVTQLLKYVYTKDYFSSFFNTLAVGGVDGTLRRRMGHPELRERVHAKTGTLSNSITLSGYLAVEGNKRLLFSIMANRLTISAHAARQTIDQICDLLVNFFGATGGGILQKDVQESPAPRNPSGQSSSSNTPSSAGQGF